MLNVLIIDDSEAARFFHRFIIIESKLSAEPFSFSSGAEAIDYLDQNSNQTDTYLILLDINMPVMNGWDLMAAIDKKSYCNQVQVIMVTSSVDRADHEKAALYRIVIGFVEKPVSLEECKRVMSFPSIARYF